MASEVRLIDGNKAEAVLRNIADHLKEAGNTDLYPATYAAADVIKQQRTINPESLRPKGRVVLKERHRGGFCKVRGLDEYGVEHTVMVDTRSYGKEPYCSECNAALAESFQIYCPRCGAKMEE